MPSTHGNANKCWCCCCWFCCRKRQKSQPRPQSAQAQYESACGCVILKIAVNIKDLYSRSQLISRGLIINSLSSRKNQAKIDDFHIFIKLTGYRTRVSLMCSHVRLVRCSHSLSYVMIRGTSHGPLNTCARWDRFAAAVFSVPEIEQGSKQFEIFTQASTRRPWTRERHADGVLIFRDL